MSDFKRVIEFSPAFDEKDTGHGIGSVQMYMTVVKDKKAVTFSLSTGWLLLHTQKDLEARSAPINMARPRAGGITTHQLEPPYPDSRSHEHCTHLDGATCYGDTCYTCADRFLELLLTGGDKPVWEALEKWWEEEL
jgi:hypothetical protein